MAPGPRDATQSASLAAILAEAGVDPEHDRHHLALAAYQRFWEPHTHTDPQVRPLWETLQRMEIRVGVLSNTIWSRAYHREVFARDGVLDLLDADVYSSEIHVVKPHPDAFRARLRRRGRGARAQRLRRRPPLRGRPRATAGRDARHPRAALRHPGGPAHAGRRRPRRRRPRAARRRWTSSPAGTTAPGTGRHRRRRRRRARERPDPDDPRLPRGRSIRRRLDRRRRRRGRPGAAAGPARRAAGGVAGAAARDEQVRLDLRHRDELGHLLPARAPRPAHRPADGGRRLRRVDRRRAHRAAHPQVGVQPDHPRAARARRAPTRSSSPTSARSRSGGSTAPGTPCSRC